MSEEVKNKVKIIIGSHGSGKSEWLYDYFIKKSRKDNEPTKIDFEKRLYLIVPEQDTNDKQRLMMKKIGDRGYNSGLFNIDVVSFDRLAYTVFERLGIENSKVIDDSGKTMILSIVISELKDELKYYGKMANRIGFAKKMTQAMSEFYSYNVIQLDDEGKFLKDENGKDINKIQEVIDNLKESDSLMKDKLSDLMLIYVEFVKKLKKFGYSIKEDKYDLLYKNLPKLKDDELFKNATFAFEGFTGFTPVQLNIFSELVKMSSETFVVVDYRPNVKKEKEFTDIYKDWKESKTNVFYLSKKFVADIEGVLKKIDSDFELKKEDYNNKNNILYKYIKTKDEEEKSDLLFVEKYLYNYDEEMKPIDKTPQNIELYEAKNAEDEIINAAHIIKRELKNKNDLRYSDIKIIVPNVEEYSKKIYNIFKKYNIQVYVDNSKSILNSPYVETIRAALDVVAYNFSYESIMRYINAGIFYKDASIFELDNFIREYGIRGYHRYKDGFKIIFDNQKKMIESQIENESDGDKKKEYEDRKKSNEDREKRIIDKKKELFDPLIKLYESITAKDFDKSVNSYVSIIQEFITEIELDNKFNSLLFDLDKEIIEEEYIKVNDEAKDGKISKDSLKKFKRKNYRLQYGKNFQLNVLNKSLEIKNKIFEIISTLFSNDKNQITIFDFKNLLDVGFTEVELKTLPQSIDQVVVGDLMRSRFDNPKIQICMGFNQSKVPASNSDNTIIDDNMRNALEKQQVCISQDTHETALNQRLYLYLALTNPTKKLIFSYPKLNINKVSDEKSTVIVAIERMFGGYVDKDGEKVFDSKLKAKKVDKYSLGFYSDEDLYDFIAENMQDLRRECDSGVDNDNNVLVKKAIKYLDKKENEKFKERFNNTFNRVNRRDDENLNSDLANKIFEKVRKGTTASVSYIESYNRCHYRHFLENTIKLRERKNFNISATDLGTYLHKVLELIFSDDKIKIDKVDDKIIEDKINEADIENIKFQNLTNGKDKYYGSNKIDAVKRLCKKILKSTIEFINYAKQDSVLNEISTEKPFSFKIGDINFIGKVDKIESKNEGDKTYINIIDYKSGKNKKTIDEDEINKGISIQLLLYLDYCINESGDNAKKSVIPCGAFYLWVDDTVKRIKKINDANNVRKNKLNSLSYDGLVNNKVECVKKIKNTLVEATDSKNVAYKEEDDTGFVISGVKFSYDDQDKLNTDLDELIKNVRAGIETSIDNIKAGDIKADPYDKANCKYCPYADICRRERFFIDEESREQKDTM